MGALILMRDERMDAPIPERFEPDDYHKDAEAKAREEYERLKGLSMETAHKEHREYLDSEFARRQTRRREDTTVVDRYKAMLVKVQAWEPPTPEHEGLKKFMVSQLEESIKWDGPSDGSFESVIETDPEKWHHARIARAMKDVDCHKQHHAEEVARTESRNNWIKTLRESLK
jgi:hypothetical protein